MKIYLSISYNFCKNLITSARYADYDLNEYISFKDKIYDLAKDNPNLFLIDKQIEKISKKVTTPEKITINFKSSRFYPKFSLVFKNKNTYQLLVNNSFRSKAEEIIQKNDKLVFTLYSVVDWYYRDCLSGDCKLLKIIEDSILVEKISDAQEDTDKLVATNPFYKLKILINK